MKGWSCKRMLLLRPSEGLVADGRHAGPLEVGRQLQPSMEQCLGFACSQRVATLAT